MKEIVLYVKKNFEKPENGLNQIIITHVLLAVGLLCTKIALLFNPTPYYIEPVLAHYFYLSSAWQEVMYKPWTLVSYFFMPIQPFSLAVHLAVLYLFARILISLLGNKRFLTLYFLGGVVGGLVFLVVYTLTPLARQADPLRIHVPAAMYAVVVGTATFAPKYVFQRFVVPIPIRYLAWFLLLEPLVQLAQGDVAATTQLGSALTGYLYIHYLKRMHMHPRALRRRSNFFEAVTRFFRFPSGPNDRSAAAGRRKATPQDLQVIFDKIATQGYDSLTEGEKQQLFDAGKKT